ncbi:disintegrin and metalloproteinase domain-containing protein 9, partial [Clonorchis sinensis]
NRVVLSDSAVSTTYSQNLAQYSSMVSVSRQYVTWMKRERQEHIHCLRNYSHNYISRESFPPSTNFRRSAHGQMHLICLRRVAVIPVNDWLPSLNYPRICTLHALVNALRDVTSKEITGQSVEDTTYPIHGGHGDLGGLAQEMFMFKRTEKVNLFNRDYDMLIFRVNSLISHVNALYAPFNIAIVVVRLELWMQDRDRLNIEEHHILPTLAQFKRMHTTLYAPFNIAIVVVRLELWMQDRDRLNIEEHHILPTLAQFKRMHTTVRHDCLHALLGERKEGSSNKGKANSHTMCVFSRCVGYTRDSPSSDILETARTMAHELGHNFGLRHDTEECKCQNCIMATGVEFGTNLMAWSPCSMRDLSVLLDYGMGACLHDTPVRTVVAIGAYNQPKNSTVSSAVRVYDWTTQSSSELHLPALSPRYRHSSRRSTATDRLCGNGVLDPGEECDCGTRESCPIQLQDCCDAQRCRLKPGSECAGGPCCRIQRVPATQFSLERFQCRLAPAGTVCRNESGNCDLPEYCDGLSGWCPSDVFKADGIPCWTEEGTESYCARGGCREADSWCRVLWGKRGRRAHPHCFDENHGIPKGVPVDPVANCGKRKPLSEERWEDPKSWPGIRCPSVQDAECGRLWCHHQNEKAMILGWIESQTRYLSSVEQSCSALVYDPVWPASDPSTWDASKKRQTNLNVAGVGILSAVTQDAGMVPDGTPCSRGMCYNGSCVPHSEIRARFQCDCRGHGICNNLGHCHCDPGFHPPFCEFGGDGGSVDSGPPPSDLIPKPSLVIGISLLVFLGLPLVVFTVYCAIYHRCRWIPIGADPIIPTKSGLQTPFDRGLLPCIRQCCRRAGNKPGGAFYIAGDANYPAIHRDPRQPTSVHVRSNGRSNGDKHIRVVVNPVQNGIITSVSNSGLKSNGLKVTKMQNRWCQPPPTAPKPFGLITMNGHKSNCNALMTTEKPMNWTDHNEQNPMFSSRANHELDNCNGYLKKSDCTPIDLHRSDNAQEPVTRLLQPKSIQIIEGKPKSQNNHAVASPISHDSESKDRQTIAISEPRLKDMTYRGPICSLSEALNTLRRGDQVPSIEPSHVAKKQRRVVRRPSRLKTLDYGSLLKKPSFRRTQSQHREPSMSQVQPRWDISAPRLESTTYTESLNDLDTARMLISR